MFRFHPAIMPYAWGCTDPEVSLVAKFAKPDHAGPFAEAWFGPIGDTTVEVGHGMTMPCSEFLRGRGYKLPALCKYLDIRDPLSIQLHPKAEDAVRLHADRPETYTDPVPKYEGAVALRNTLLLLGWKPVAEIRRFLQLLDQQHLPGDIKHLVEWGDASVVGDKYLTELTVRALNIRSGSFPAIRSQLQHCMAGTPAERYPAFMESWSRFFDKTETASDVGLLFAGFLNVVELQAHQAVFIPVGVPHAYLFGQVAEVMYPSDNVIRLGLTPKPIDRTEARKCLDYRERPVTEYLRFGTGGSAGLMYELGQGLGISSVKSGPTFGIKTRTNAEVLVFMKDADGTMKLNSGKSVPVAPYTAYLLQPATHYNISLRTGTAIRFYKRAM